MKPDPTRQSRQAHRQRKALGRALHQVKMMRTEYWQRSTAKGRLLHFRAPRIVRKHSRVLYLALAGLG